MRTSSEKSNHLVPAVLTWSARGLICLLLLAAPWPYGMAEWASQVWLVPVMGAVLVLSSIVALWRRLSIGNPLVWCLACVLMFGFVQVLPLPEGLWQNLSAGAGFQQQSTQLAQSFGEISLDDIEPFMQAVPHTLSIHPLQTRASLCVMAMGLAMLISASLVFRDRQGVIMLLATLGLSGLAVAVLGIYQAVVAGDWTLIDVPKASSFGPFYSRNSAPQFLACAFAATAGLTVLYLKKDNRKKDRRYQITYPSVNMVARLRRRIDEFVVEIDVVTLLLLLAMILQAIGILTANSRGGTLSFFASLGFVGLVYALGKQASVSAMLGVFVLLLCAGLFLSFFGIDELIGQRLNTVSEEAYTRDNARLELWWLAFSQPSIWLFGSGLGTFHFAILPAYQAPQSTWFYHAENIYVELASNAGVWIMLVALAGLLWLLWQLLTRQSNSTAFKSVRLACLLATLAVMLQNLVDFSLMLPAVFLPLAALLGAYLSFRNSGSTGSFSAGSSSAGSLQRQGQAHPVRGAGKRSGRSNGVRRSPDSRDLDELIEQPAGAGDRNLGRTWTPASLIVCLLLISAAVAAGYQPLRAFAYAEQFRNREIVAAVGTDGVDYATLLARAEQERWSGFPESQLQIGRVRQEYATDLLLNSPTWPSDVTLPMRSALSHPEFFTTVFHETQDAELQQLKKFIELQPEVLTTLEGSQAEMLAALGGCPLDWRANWGLLRADTGELSTAQRRLNYARILLTCRNNQPVMQAAATHAMMIGESTVGLRLWQELLPVSWQARNQVVGLLDRFMTIEQLVDAMPQDPLMRLELAYRLDPAAGKPNARAMLDSADLQAAKIAAEHAADWQLIAWAAKANDDLETEITAWHAAALDDPQDHRIGYSYAEALSRGNFIAQALAEIQRARENTVPTAAYEALFKDLQARQ